MGMGDVHHCHGLRQTFVELNHIPGGNLKNEIGNFGSSDEGIARLISILSEAIRRHRDHADDTSKPMEEMSLDELKALSEEHGIDVTFGDDPDNSTSPNRASSDQGKKSTSDDPF